LGNEVGVKIQVLLCESNNHEHMTNQMGDQTTRKNCKPQT